jgi:hypothetical protein
MKIDWFVPTVLLSFATVAVAQESAPTPVAEVGLNYSLTNFHPGNGVSAFTASGGGGSFVYDLNKVFGIAADLRGYHNGAAANLDTTTFSYLFGPRFSWRRSKVTPYAQALLGGVRMSSNVLAASDGSALTERGFATAFGGGIDIALTHHIALRPVQLDYFMTRVPDFWTNGQQNNLRYSAGMVFRFGSK